MIDFVMMMDGLSFRDACKAISGEYPRGKGGFEAQRARLRKMAEDGRRRELNRKINKALDTVREYWQKLQNMEPEDEGYADILLKWHYANYAADCMIEEER